MDVQTYLNRKSIMYDVLLSVLYAWSVFLAYLYDAKTRTTGILIYVLVYGGFTLLVRSTLGVFLMNLLSAITLPWIFTVPAIQQAGGYFDFQPYLGIAATILIGLIQGVLSIPLLMWGSKFLRRKHQYIWSAIVAGAFTLILTMSVSLVPIRP
jgi:hypothetical protein